MHYFETEAEFNQERHGNYYEPWVSYTEESDRVDYNKPDYAKIPFTIETLGSGNITWYLGTKTVQYSKNGGSWETMDSETTISVIEGDEVQFKGTNSTYCEGYDASTISTTAPFNVKGNIMSLTDGDDFETANIIHEHCFEALFYGCTHLVSACDLKLPVTTLARHCYNDMFNGCTNLTTAPELPATTLAISCYSDMFANCTSLTTSPELPATTLVSSCYNYMFNGCSNLNYVKAMFTTTPTAIYTNNWLSGVASTGTFVKNANATWTTTGVNGVPTGWTVQTASA